MNHLHDVNLRRFFYCMTLALMLTGCNHTERTSPPAQKAAVTGVLAKTTVLATITADQSPRNVETYTGHSESPAARNLPASLQVVFSADGNGVAYVVEADKQCAVVYKGKVGKSYKIIEDLTLSDDGSRLAYNVRAEGNSRVVLDGIEGLYFEETNPPLFSPDGRHLAYMAKAKDKWFLVIDNTFLNEGALNYRGNPFFSADSRKIVSAETVSDDGKVRLVISDLKFNRLAVKESCGSHMIINAQKTRIAAVAERNGRKQIVEFALDSPDKVMVGKEYDTIESQSLVYSPDGMSVAYVAGRDGAIYMVLGDKEERLPVGSVVVSQAIRPDRAAVGVILSAGGILRFHECFSGARKSEREYEEAGDLVYNRDGSLHAYTARRGADYFLVVNGTESPAYDRVVTPQFSPDGRYVVSRVRKSGQRFVMVADGSARMIKQLNPYEMVFQPVFTADGSSFGYGVKDGAQLIWKVDTLK